jgi:hypothetical protein
LIAAKQSALITTQFYSNVDFSAADSNIEQAEGRSKNVQLTNLDMSNVRQRMLEAKEKYVSAKDNQTKEFKL